MKTAYTIVSRAFPVTLVAWDDYAAKFLALYLISAEMAFSVDCVEKTSCRFQILVPAIDDGLDYFLRMPPLARPVSRDDTLFAISSGVLVGVETDLTVTVNGTNSSEQNAAFIAQVWQMMCLSAPLIVIH
ncbi:MAG: hypothetical protein NT121_24635 [Chloroflexi bacterium]|nr:hypothetical protein [Chloroflexota bacterium]